MTRIERIREVLTGPLTDRVLAERAKSGWRHAAVEWVREIEGMPVHADPHVEQVPYGLRVSEDCAQLHEDPGERAVLEVMLDLIVTEKSLREVAEEMNRQGCRTRKGSRWTQTEVFNMLPRLIEAAPSLRRVPPDHDQP
ncbi:MAG: recombinase family protein [Acidobacteriota bacterium]